MMFYCSNARSLTSDEEKANFATFFSWLMESWISASQSPSQSEDKANAISEILAACHVALLNQCAYLFATLSSAD